jgi:UMF1 family MFS transporter
MNAKSAGKDKNTSIPTIVAWSLFDWASAAFPVVITTFIFASYFTRAIAIDPITGMQQWGYAIAVAGIIIALLSPFLGAVVDQLGHRKPWIAFFATLTIISTALLWFSKPSPDYIYWALGWLILATIGFELCLLFYYTMMNQVVSEKYLGRLSGWAWSLGYAGGLACLVVALLLVQSDQWSGIDSTIRIRLCGPLVAVWFLVFSLPFFFLVPDEPKKAITILRAIPLGINTFLKNVRNLKKDKQMWLFLLARMTYIDGLNTIFVFGGIYAANEFGLQPQEIILFGIMMNVCAGIGAAGFAWFDDSLGSKKIILIALGGLIFSLVGLLLVKSILLFWIMAIFLAFFVGPTQAASRTLMVRLSRPDRMAENFGLFVFSGRSTSFIGPWLVGTATALFSSQRIGMAFILIFLVLGALILKSVEVQTVRQ